MRIVVIVPTYNEAGAIGGVLEELKAAFLSAPEFEWHAVVVDGNSTDETQQIVARFCANNPSFHLLAEPEKRGLALAYLAGIRYAIDELGADAFVEFDGDGQHDPAYLPTMAEALTDGADYVIGSRYIAGGSVPREWRLYNRLLSRFGSLYSRLLLELPVHDATSGYKMTRVAGYADKLSLTPEELLTRHYAYKIQLVSEMHRLGATIVEVPIAFRHRAEGTSKSTSRDVIESLKVTAILRLQQLKEWRLLRVLAVGGMGFVLQAVIFELLGIQGTLSASTAALLGCEAAVLSNFFLNNLFSFSDLRASASPLLLRLFKFHLVSSGSLLTQWLLILCVEQLTESAMLLRIAFVVGVGIGFLINYTGYYFWVWKSARR